MKPAIFQPMCIPSGFVRRCLPGVLGGLVLLMATVPAFADWKAVNESIKNRVETLTPPIQGYELTIDYQNGGRVILQGSAASMDDVDRIAAAARSVEGVTEVENRLIVAPMKVASVSKVTEGISAQPSGMAEKVQRALSRDLPDKWFEVAVAEGSGGLAVSGVVDTPATAKAILSIAQRESGMPVIDNLKVRPDRSDESILAEIEGVIGKEYPGLSKEVTPSVHNGVVTLKGNMADHWDIDKVLATIVMIDGVKDINSQITINGKPYSSAGHLAHKK